MVNHIAQKIVAALIVGAVSVAHASDVTIRPEVGAGIAHYGVEPDGIWYQLGATHDLQRNGRAWQIGVGGQVAHFRLSENGSVGLDYHVDYVNLGHASASCMCAPDDDYSPIVHRITNPSSYLVRYSGNGYAQGIKLALAPYFAFRDVRIGYEYGAYVFRPGWRDTAYNWASTAAGPFVTVAQYTPSDLVVGRVFGIFLQRRKLTVSYENFRLPVRAGERNVPPFYTGAQVVMLTYQL